MPYIKVSANVDIAPEKAEALKSELGQAVQLINKTEDWLMVEINGNAPLYFKGDCQPAAMVSVNLYGKAGKAAYAQLTAAICKMLNQQLNIPQNRVFVSYAEYEHWGWNGNNF